VFCCLDWVGCLKPLVVADRVVKKKKKKKRPWIWRALEEEEKAMDLEP
jgi:hypothetical protein